jgi:CPA2 family monovalent cation:H+ antiporter-2
LGTRLLPKLLRFVLSWESRELFLISVVAIGVGIGYATYMAGLSFALGAFVAGLVLSESEFSHQALSDVVPIRDIFGLLFFVSVGMLLEPVFVINHARLIAAVVVSTLVGKAVITGLLARSFGYVNMAPWIIGLGLAQIGEFSFVLARTGMSSGMLSKTTYDLVLTATVLTMALSPLEAGLAVPLGRGWQRWRKPPPATRQVDAFDPGLQGQVVVAGYGRTGKAAARVLQRAEVPLVVVEINHAVYSRLAGDGLAGMWGDVTGEEILKAAGIERARVLLLTVPDQTAVHLSAERARRLNPEITVIARASRVDDVGGLLGLGVDSVIQPEFEGGIEMVRQALQQYRPDDAEAARLIADLRAEFYGSETAVKNGGLSKER